MAERRWISRIALTGKTVEDDCINYVVLLSRCLTVSARRSRVEEKKKRERKKNGIINIHRPHAPVSSSSDVPILGLRPPHTRVMRQVRPNQVRKLRVDVHRRRYLWDMRHILVVLLALPELLAAGLAAVRRARVDRRRRAVAEETRLRGRPAVVRGQHRVACVA
jgi:hypothetical protein